jgi:hypothetical protein
VPEIIGEPMDAERERELRLWLKKPEVRLLQTVLSAKSRFEKEKALTEALRSDGVNNYELKSIASMKSAARYETALEVLFELAKQETPFQIVKLKP